MYDFMKKNYIEPNQEKPCYNINSFRGIYTDKNKTEKEIKISHNINSSRILPTNSSEKIDKDFEQKNKRELKPRLLTGKLPAAFDMKNRK
jgi:hypothetical protein